MPKDDAGHQPGQGDVSGGGDSPAVGHDAEVIAPAVEDPGQQKEQSRRTENPAQCPHQRVDGLAYRVQRSAGQDRLGNLLGGNTKEEHHEDLIDQEVDRNRLPEDLGVVAEDVEIHHAFIGMDVNVGKDQPGNHANDEWYGELLKEAYVMWAEQRYSPDIIYAGRPPGANSPRIISSRAGF